MPVFHTWFKKLFQKIQIKCFCLVCWELLQPDYPSVGNPGGPLFHSIPFHSSQASCKHLVKLYISGVLPSSYTIFEPTPVFLLYPHCKPLSSPPEPRVQSPSLHSQPRFSIRAATLPTEPALGPFWKSAMPFPSLRPFQKSLLSTNS